MSGIKDLHGLLFWLDGGKGKQSIMEKTLSNNKQLSREKAHILRELKRENWQMPIKKRASKFVNKPSNY